MDLLLAPCPTVSASHFESEWETPQALWLWQSGRQVAISISATDSQDREPSSQGERTAGNCVGSSLGWGAGKGNFLLGLGEERGRRNEKVGVVQEWSLLPRGLAKPPPARGGRAHEQRRSGVRKAGGAVLRPEAELKVSSREGRKLRALCPLRLASPAAAVGQEAWGKRPPGPEGHKAAPITRASGRGRPDGRSVKPGAEGAAVSGDPSLSLLGVATPSSRRGTCTARLRKVPASAASFFTLKSMMFILGVSRTEQPADLAGRWRRRGRAGAPGKSGGGRRGRWREAAPASPPQLSFPWRGRERVGRGERTTASKPAARPGGSGRDPGPVPPGEMPLTSAGFAVGLRDTEQRPGLSGPGPQPRKRERASGRGLYRGYRGNSDPFRSAAAERLNAPGAPVQLGGGSRSLLGARLRAAVALGVCA